MCQKAFGSYFAPLAGVRLNLTWVRGTPGTFNSSEAAERGFCRECGTPLFSAMSARIAFSVSLSSLDDPGRIAPAGQFGIESRLPFVATLTTLPGTSTEDGVPPEAMAPLNCRQHPDRPD